MNFVAQSIHSQCQDTAARTPAFVKAALARELAQLVLDFWQRAIHSAARMQRIFYVRPSSMISRHSDSSRNVREAL
jgi:hypothetical protein